MSCGNGRVLYGNAKDLYSRVTLGEVPCGMVEHRSRMVGWGQVGYGHVWE